MVGPVTFSGAWILCQGVFGLSSDMGSAIAGAVMAVITLPLAAWAAETKANPGVHRPGEDQTSSPDGDPAEPLATVRSGYLDRMRQRYRELDIGVLTPRPERDENPPVSLAEIFVGPSAQADPPLLELPRELVLQLAADETAPVRHLPEGIDRADLERARQAFQQRQAAPVLDLLAGDGHRLMVLGDAGAGKSTLARYVALTLAGDDPDGSLRALSGWLPVLVELRKFTQRGGGTFLDFLDHLHHKEGAGLPKQQLEQYLAEDGRALVIFDGLDEVFDPDIREQTAQEIAWFAERFPRARVIVTSRPLDDQSTVLPGFTRHKLADLDRDQIGAFVTRWYRATYPKDPARAARLTGSLLKAVDGSAAVRELAGNPLLLTILAIMGRRRKLPRDRVSVYRHAVGVLVEQWDRGKQLRPPQGDPALPFLNARDRLQLLRLVARRMQHAPGGLAGNFISEPELIDEITGYLRSRDNSLTVDRGKYAANAMLRQFHERNFILSQFGDDVYGFVHRSFLEYLVADDICQRFNDERSITENELVDDLFGARWRDPAWHEVLVLTAGLLHERMAARSVARMLAADPHWAADDRAEPQHVLLAIRCLGEVGRTGVAAADACRAAIDQVIRVLTVAHRRVVHDFDDALNRAVERSALPVLAASGGHWPGRERYLAWYTRSGLVDTDDPTTSALATRLAVALLGDDPALYEFLRTKAYHGWSVHHRQAAVWAVATAWSDDADGVALVRDRAGADPDPAVRLTAVQAIAAARPDDPQTAALLRRTATADRHEEVRRSALHAIAHGRREDPGTLRLLRELAEESGSGHVRHAAVQAVADYTSGDPSTVERLRRWAVEDESEDVRATALRAVAAIRPRDIATLRLLRTRAETDGSIDVRRAATKLVAEGWRADPVTLPWLRAQVDDRNPGIRQTALQAIAAGWPERADTSALLADRAADDPSADVREAALDALHTVGIGDAELPERLRTIAAYDPSPEVRQAAVRAVADPRREDPRTLPWLRQVADTAADEQVRRTAVRMIADTRTPSPDTLAWLREKASGDDSLGVRRAALQTIATGRRDNATRLWLHDRTVEDPDADVRHAAVQAIVAGWPGDLGTLAWLRELALADRSAHVRRAALRAIAAHWRDDPDTPVFLRERMSGDPRENVRRAAVWSLANGWPDDDATLPALRDSTADRHHHVRTAAVQALAADWHDHPGTLPLLRERAVADPDGYVRHTALQAIAAHRHDDPDTLSLLVERAAADERPPVRLELLRTVVLGWTHDDRSLSLTIDRATHDTHSAVRQAATQALADRWPDQPSALTALRERAATDSDEEVRHTAALALAARPADPAA